MNCFGRRRANNESSEFVALSSLVEGLSLKVTGIICPQTSDDSLFAAGTEGKAQSADSAPSHNNYSSLPREKVKK